MRLQDKRKRISIYINKKDRWQGRPLYKVITEKLYAMEVSGCTVLPSVGGYGTNYRIRFKNRFTFSKHRGLVMVILETARKADQIINEISPLIEGGVITIEDVEMIRINRDGATRKDLKILNFLRL